MGSCVCSPDEYPFTKNLPDPVLKPLDFPKILYPNTVNANAEILKFYTNDIVPRITKQATDQLAAAKRAKGCGADSATDDDGNHGSAATVDVEVLQAISKRVHYGAFRLCQCSFETRKLNFVYWPTGKFVSESKFREKPSDFIPHILNPNREALEALITKPAVERALLARLKKKAAFYGQDLGPDGQPVENGGSTKIDVEGVKDLYEKYIIPLTKDVEVSDHLHSYRSYSPLFQSHRWTTFYNGWTVSPRPKLTNWHVNEVLRFSQASSESAPPLRHKGDIYISSIGRI